MVVEREKKNSNSKKASKYFSKKYLALAVAAVATGLLPVDMGQQADSNQGTSRNPLRWAINAANKLSSMLAPRSAAAAVYYWDTTTTGTWSTGANWSNNASSGGTTGTVPLSTDTVLFNQSSVNGNETVQLSQAQSIAGMTFANTGTTLLDSSSATTQTLTLGTSGITINSGTGAITLGNGTNQMNIALIGNQSWANNSSSLLTVTSNITNTANTSPFTLTLNGSGTGGTTIGGIISNGGTTGTTSVVINTTGGTTTLSGANTYTGGTTVSAGTLREDFTARTNGTQVNLGTVTVTGTLELFAPNGTIGNPTLFIGGTNIVGTGTITKTGAGYADFWNGNGVSSLKNFAGLVDIQAGFLSNQSDWDSSAGSMSLNVASNAFFDLRTDSAVINRLTGSGTIGSSFTAGMVLTVGAQNGSSTFNGVIQNTVPGFANSPTIALIKNGIGTLTLTGTNTYTGGTTVSGGTLQLGTAGLLGNGSYAGAISLTGTLQYSSSAAQTLSSVISGAGVLLKDTSTSALTLSGANPSWSGGLVVKAGTVNLNTNANAAGTGTITLGDSVADANAVSLFFNQSATLANAINVALGTTGTISLGNTSGGSTFSGSITLNNNLTFNTSGSNAGMNFSGTITGTGNIITKNTSGTTGTINFTNTVNNVGTISNIGTSTGTVTYSGGVGSNVTTITENSTLSPLTISTAALTVNTGGTTLVNSAGTSLLTVSGGVTGSGNLILNNNSSTDAGITLSGTSVNNTGTITNSGSGTGGVTISSIIGTNVTGMVQNSATSTLTLTGVNTYSSGTMINAGTLIVGVAGVGSIASSAVTVNSGGTLKGSGTTGAVTINSGGILSPGNSPGTLTTGATTYNNGGTYQWEINNTSGTKGAVYDWQNITGTLTVAATAGTFPTNTFQIDITGLNAGNTSGAVQNWNPHNSYTLTLATASSGISGFAASDFTLTTTNFTNNNSLGGGAFSITTSGNDLNLVFTGAAVATEYWDINGATAGAGGATPSGTWSTGTANWSYSPTGVAATNNWTNGDNAVLSAGSDATGSYTLTLSGGVTAQNITMEEGTSILLTGSTLTLAGTTPTITVTGATQAMTIGSVITDTAAAGLTKAGSGTLSLSGINTYTGGTTISAGTLQIGTAGSLGSGSYSAAITNNGSLVYSSSATQTLSGAISGTGSIAVAGGQLILGGSASNTYSGTTTLSGASQLGLSKTGSAVAISGDISMAASGTRSVLWASQDNQFGANSVMRWSGSGDTRFELSGTTQTLAGVDTTAFSTGGTFAAIEYHEFGTVTPGGSISTLILNVAAGNSFTFGNSLGTGNVVIRDFSGGSVRLIKNGLGTQSLVGVGIAYTGATTVNNGMLDLTNASSYASATTVGNGATLRLTNTANEGLAPNITLNSGGTIIHNGQTNGGDFITMSGTLTVSGSTTINENSVTNTTGANKNFFLDGGLAGSGTLTINAANAGNAVELRNNNSTFSGLIIVNGISNATVNLGSGIGVGGTSTTLSNADFQLNGTMEILNQGIGWAGGANNFAMGALSGTGTLVGNFTGGGIETLTVGSTNNSGNFSGTIVNGTGNTMNLTKVGTGTQTLSGVNTYTGSTNMVSGTLNVTGSISHSGNDLDFNSAGNSVLIVSGSVTALHLYTGNLSGGVGAVYVNGGTLTMQAADIAYDFGMGIATGGYGYFNMTSGSVTTNRFTFGGRDDANSLGGTGVGFMSGGTITNNSFMILAQSGTTGANPTGQFTITGGTINRTAISAGAIYIGESGGAGRAELNVAGGTILNTGSTGGNVRFGGNGGFTGTGIVDLTAGTLTASAFINVSGTAFLNFNGGTLQSTASSATFLPALSTVTVNGAFGSNAGGAVIDTNGFNDTISAPLLAPSGDGVTTITVSNSGTGYIGAPYVSITGGTGSGATAIANMVDDGTGKGTFMIGSITITNPGNYSVDPTTVTISGGGPATAGTLTIGTTAANISGGLTKIGAGTLTTTGVNTYTGTNTLNAGVLNLGVAEVAGTSGPLGSSAAANAGNIVLSGGTLQYSAANQFDYSGRFSTAASQQYNVDTNGQAVTWATALTSSGGSLTKIGTGTLTLTGTSTYSGATTINGGKLVVGVSGVGSIANSAVTINSGGTLKGSGTTGAVTINSGGTLAPGNSPGTINTGNTIYNNGGTYQWEVNNITGTKGIDPGWDFQNITGTLNIAATSGGFTIDITGLNTSNVSGGVSNWNPHNSYTLTLATASGGISGFAAGDFTLATTNFTNNTSIGSGAFSIANSGNDLNLVFTGSAAPANAYWDINGATAGAGGATPSGTWSTTGAANWNFSADGTGTTNNWTNGDNAIFSAGADATGSYTLTLSGGITAQNITMTTGTSNSILLTASTLTLAGTTPTITITNAAQSMTINSVVTDSAAAGLIKAGLGTLTLSGTNTYAGSTAINAGVLSTGTTGILANGGTASSIGQSANTAANLVLNGSTLQYANTGAAESTDRLFTIAGGTTATLDASGTNSITFSNTGSIAFTGSNTTQTLTLTGTGAGVLTPNLGNNGTGATSLIKSGSGTWSLGGTNTYSGGTTVSAGFLALTSAANVVAVPGNITMINAAGTTMWMTQNGQLGGSGTLTFSGASSNARFDLGKGQHKDLAGLVETNGLGVVQNSETAFGGPSNSGNATLTLNGSGPYSFNGFLRNGSAGTLALVDNVTGTQTLSGGNIAYTGATTVNSGRLILSTASGFNSATTVNNATLDLAGATNIDHPAGFALTLNNSTLNKTNTGYDTFNASNVTLSGTTAINITNNGSSNQLFIGGSGTGLTGSGTLTLTNSGSSTTGLSLRTGVNATHFNGAVIVNGGVVNVSSGAGLVFDNTDLTLTGAILNMSGSESASAGRDLGIGQIALRKLHQHRDAGAANRDHWNQ